jgi:hypothetical protein
MNYSPKLKETHDENFKTSEAEQIASDRMACLRAM